MAVIIAKNNAGEYNFVDNITDQEKKIINEANQTTTQGNAQEEHNSRNDNEQSDSSENGDITGPKENTNGSVQINTPSDLKINKDTAVKIKMLLNSWLSDICTENEYKLFSLIEDKLQNESIAEADDTDSYGEETDDGTTIYTNMQQLFEYYNNISDGEDSPNSSLSVARCTYWDGHTQDVMLHRQGEPNEEGPNKSL